MAELPPLNLKITGDLSELRIVVDELSAALKRIDERIDDERRTVPDVA